MLGRVHLSGAALLLAGAAFVLHAGGRAADMTLTNGGSRFTYEGVLRTEGEEPPTAPVRLSFALFRGGEGDVADSGELLYGETCEVNAGPGGKVSHVIGTGTRTYGSLSPGLLSSAGAGDGAAQALWLQVAVGEEQKVILPRTRLSGVPWAAAAGNADSLGGFPASAYAKLEDVLGGGSSEVRAAGTGTYSTIGGGYNNTASGNFSTVSGGGNNSCAAPSGVIGGGWYNRNFGLNSVVGGGEENFINGAGYDATIGGGNGNQANAFNATVGGGFRSVASASFATIGGGERNQVTGQWGMAGGGQANLVKGNVAAIAGGANNQTSDTAAFIGGGSLNKAAKHAVVSGGEQNSASGEYSTIPGGALNSAPGRYSFAAGRRARSIGPGTFTWADTTNEDFYNYEPDQFRVRARGGATSGWTALPRMPSRSMARDPGPFSASIPRETGRHHRSRRGTRARSGQRTSTRSIPPECFSRL